MLKEEGIIGRISSVTLGKGGQETREQQNDKIVMGQIKGLDTGLEEELTGNNKKEG